MPIFATISSRIVRVIGNSRAWGAASVSDPASRPLPFRFDITDDGNDNFLLVYESLDGEFYADTWYANIEEALAAAEQDFGVMQSEWANPST